MKACVISAMADATHPQTIADVLGLPLIRHRKNHKIQINKTLESVKGGGFEKALIVFPSKPMKEMVEKLRKIGVKAASYWLGQDALNLLKDKDKEGWPEFDIDIVCSNRLWLPVSAGGSAGGTVVVNFFTPRDIQASQVPKEKCVAVYMPNMKPKYRFDEMREVAKRMIPMPFVFYGAREELESCTGNVTKKRLCSPEEAVEILRKSTCVVRFTEHDGLPQNIIEAKMLERTVLSSYQYPGCIEVKGIDDICAALQDESTHEQNSEASNLYRKSCTRSAFYYQMNQILEGL